MFPPESMVRYHQCHDGDIAASALPSRQHEELTAPQDRSYSSSDDEFPTVHRTPSWPGDPNVRRQIYLDAMVRLGRHAEYTSHELPMSPEHRDLEQASINIQHGNHSQVDSHAQQNDQAQQAQSRGWGAIVRHYLSNVKQALLQLWTNVSDMAKIFSSILLPYRGRHANCFGLCTDHS